MRLLFVSTTFPFPPRDGVELPLAFYMEHLAREHEISFALLASPENTDEVGRATVLPPWLSRVVIVPVTLRSTTSRYWKEFTFQQPSFFPYEMSPRTIVGLFRDAQYDVIWHSPVGVRSFSRLYQKYVDPRVRCFLGGYDVIHSLYFEQGMLILRGREKLGLNKLSRLVRSFGIALMERRYLREFNLIQVHSWREQVRLRHLFTGISSPPVIVAPNGLKEELFKLSYISARGQANILFITHCDPGRERQVRWFLHRVWPVIFRARPSARLHLVGSPAQGSFLSELQGAHGIILRGFVEPYAQAFTAMTVAVLPLWQTVGHINRIIDSMAAGVPLVGNYAALSTIRGFQNGIQGIAARSAQEFAHSIITLLDNPRRCREISQKARELVMAEYQWEHSLRVVSEALQKFSTKN